MELADQLREIITSEGIAILAVLCFYIFHQLSGAIFLCKEKVTSKNKLYLTIIIAFGHLFKALSLGLGFLFLLHFMKVSGTDLGQAFKSLFNIQKGSDGSGASIVKFIALIMTVISGLVLSIAHKQVEKLDKELESIKEKADEEIKIIKDKSDAAVNSVDNETKKIKKDAKEFIDGFSEELDKIKEESKKEKNSLEDLKESLSHISSQNIANIEINKLIQQSKNSIATLAQKPDLEIFRDLIGYEFNRTPSVVVIDAIDALSKNNINKEWLEDNSIFSNYIGSLYKQFSRIDTEDNSYEEVMRKIKPFVPESFFSLK